MIVVGIREEVELDDEVVAACEELHRKGYLLAVDQYSADDRLNPLGDLAGIVMVDFARTPVEERRRLVQRFAPRGAEMLAASVEDAAEHDLALRLGYSYFQGRFFAKPAIITGRDVQGSKLNYVRLLREINRPGLNFDQVEEIIRHEVSLSYKLLRYINSVAFGLRNKVNTIRQALVLLGQRGIQKWASVVVMADIGLDKPPELIVASLLRARFLEAMAESVGLADRAQDQFLLGMFSLIDVLTERPLPELVGSLSLDADVKAALLDGTGPLRPLYDLLLVYEGGDWPAVSRLAGKLGLSEASVADAYLKAMEWSSSAAEMDRGRGVSPSGT